MTSPAEDRNPAPGHGRVRVAGSVNMDLVITSSRRPRVGETVIGDSAVRLPGGKGSNQALAAAASGAPVEFIGAVGSDDAGTQLRAFLHDKGVDVTNLRSIEGVASGVAVVIVAEGDNAVVVVSGANAHVGRDLLGAVPIQPEDVLVSQFEIAEDAVQFLFERGSEAGALTVLNPSPMRAFSEELWALSDVVVLNEIELLALRESLDLSVPPSRLLDGLDSLLTRTDQTLMVTLGARGCALTNADGFVSIPGHPVAAIDTTGAGDCFVGYLAGRLLEGDDLRSAARFANAAASLSVQRMGAGSSMPAAEEVTALLAT